MISMWEVLKASKGLPVSDFYAAMWGKQIAGKYTIAELEGALPLTFNANGEALIDYRIYGNTVQSGTPTPENPIMPIGCGERTENLWDEEYLNGYYTSSNTFVSANNQICSKSKIAVKPNTAYWLGVTSNLGTAFLGVLKYNKNAEFIERENAESYKGNGVVFTTDANTYYININFGAYYGSVYNGDIIIAESSTLISYEPYGYKLPLTSAGQNANIYLGEAETTRRIKKLVLTGEENITFSSEDVNRIVGHFTIPNMDMAPYVGYCNILKWKPNYPQSEYNRIVAYAPTSFYVSLEKSILPEPTFDGFKSYFAQQYTAGTPVTMWYVHGTPETGIVNEPLMKIGDYADTVDSAQTNVQIPTFTGTTVIDYDGTPKPSQMYIKYLGVKND